jgi:hypothetical protein
MNILLVDDFATNLLAPEAILWICTSSGCLASPDALLIRLTMKPDASADDT